MTALMDATAARLAALDLRAENARIEALEAERRNIAEAIERADTRKTEIARELADVWREDGGARVADALLADQAATVAAEEGVNREKLLQERAALHAGTGELRRRDVDLSAEIADVQREAAGKVAREVAPVIGEILHEARAAAGKLLNLYGAMAGIVAATRTGGDTADALGQAVAGMMTGGSLIQRQNVVEVPADIREMVAGLADKGPALRPAMLTVAGVPDDRNMILAMGATARMIADGKR
jgi:hypothetical protein